MRSFNEILDIAVQRKGSREAILGGMDQPLSDAELAAQPDATWLEAMAGVIFQAGISSQVVRNKWPGITEALKGFDIARVAMMSDDWFDELVSDTRVIRSPPKIRAIQENAYFIQQVAQENGSFGRKIADWPVEDFHLLLKWLKDEGSRLGGNSGAYVMRYCGKESYILTSSVVARLIAEGVVDKAPTSQKAMVAVQEAFNTWKAQSGESLNTISRVLAQSIDG